ncbi:MAG TPA: hypothetical protein VGL19_10515 [Polyangiaceae bacterium]|jgi:hypothetical protein
MTSVSRAGAKARRASRLGALLTCSLLLFVGSAHAQEDAETRTAARDLATQGGQAFDAGKYAEASDFFRRAHELVAAPSIALMHARSLAKLGQLLAAMDVYEQTARVKLADDAPEAYVTAVQTARVEIEELRTRIPRLKLTVLGTANGDGAQVTIDDKPTPAALLGVERPVDPGVHRFAVHVGGQTRAARDLTVLEGQSYQVELDAHPAEPAAKPALEAQGVSSGPISQRTLGYVGLGVGGLGFVVGTYTGLVALHHKSNLDSVCQPGCPASSASEIDGWRSNRTASWVSYGVGVAAAGAGVLLLVFGKPNQEHVAISALPNGVQIGGQL